MFDFVINKPDFAYPGTYSQVPENKENDHYMNFSCMPTVTIKFIFLQF